MTRSNDKCNIVHENDLLLQGAQNERMEVISPIYIRAAESANNGNQKSKWHGNKKLQRFKRKRRVRGLNEEEIITFINTKSHDISERSVNESMMNSQIEIIN
ncbi:unnamed protein product [Rotaria socialis]